MLIRNLAGVALKFVEFHRAVQKDVIIGRNLGVGVSFCHSAYHGGHVMDDFVTGIMRAGCDVRGNSRDARSRDGNSRRVRLGHKVRAERLRVGCTTLASTGNIPIMYLDPHDRLVLSKYVIGKRHIVFCKMRGKNVINEPLTIVLGVTRHLAKITGKFPMKGRNTRVAGIVRISEEQFGDPWRPGAIHTKLLGPST
jgi:hypothetical protein